MLSHVYEHLEERLDLIRLAEVAGFSARHWHRVFSSAFGESLPSLVRRVRMQRALELVTIRGGRYAVLTHVGAYADMPDSYAWFFGCWVPRSGRELSDDPVVEHYVTRPQNGTPAEMETNLMLPLAERSRPRSPRQPRPRSTAASAG